MNSARRRLIGLPLALGLGAFASAARATDALTWGPLKQTVRTRFPAVRQLTVPELTAWLRDGARPAPLLIDTRSAEEYADGHLPGALHAESVAEVQRLLGPQAAARPLVLYCSVGCRSSALATALSRPAARGAALSGPVYNLEGSIFEWANAGQPVVDSDSNAAKVHPLNRKWGTLLRRELWSREP